MSSQPQTAAERPEWAAEYATRIAIDLDDMSPEVRAGAERFAERLAQGPAPESSADQKSCLHDSMARSVVESDGFAAQLAAQLGTARGPRAEPTVAEFAASDLVSAHRYLAEAFDVLRIVDGGYIGWWSNR